MSATKFFPRRLSFPKLCDILVAYLNAGADKEHIGVSEVVSRSTVTLHNISRNNNFLKSWNFLDESPEEPGKYRLDKEAAEFAYAYRIDPNGERTREMLRGFLSRDVVLGQFVERIRHEKLSRDAVLVELPRVVGDLRADRVGLGAFLDMIAYAFQLEEIATLLRPVSPPREQRRVVQGAREAPKALFRPEAPTPRADISINLTISPDISPERLKAYVKAMLEAYDEYGREKTSENDTS